MQEDWPVPLYTRGEKPDDTEEKVEDRDRRTGKRKQLGLCQKKMCKDLQITPGRKTGVGPSL